ncbi:MAG: glutathione peroxidase [Chitinophagales bacterium]|nr:glutathione peroxidase [Chitinophagales bacterium]
MTTFRQKLLKVLYPIIRFAGRFGNNGTILKNEQGLKPVDSIYDFDVELIIGKTISLSQFKGKNLIIVNTASDCGYAGQYQELQALYEKYGNKLMIIAFPSNDFAEQEKYSDAAIQSFCQINYGVKFLVAKKAVVSSKENQHPVFKWLTNSQRNGWNNHNPDWNFSKYFINKEGTMTHYFGPSISPLDTKIINLIN